MLQPVRIKGPFRGLVTRKDAVLLADNEASDLSNVILSSNGIEARKGVVAFATKSDSIDTFSDTFTRADSASLGTGWSDNASNGQWDIASNALKWTNTTGASLKYGIAHQAPGTAYAMGSSAIVQAEFSSTATAGGGYIYGGLAARVRSNSLPHYAVIIPGPDGAGTSGAINSISIVAYWAGAYTVLARDTDTSSTYRLGSTAITLRMVCIGPFIGAYVYRNGAWELRCSVMDWSVRPDYGGNLYSGHGVVGGTLVSTNNTLSFSCDNYKVIAYHGISAIYPEIISLPGSSILYRRILTKSTDGYQRIDSAGNVTSASSVPSMTAFGMGMVPSRAHHNGFDYICDWSTKPYLREASTGSFYNLIITKPSATPTLASGGAGNLTGVYEWKYTYLNSTTGTESMASPTTAQIIVNGEDVDISGMTLSADSDVDKHRLYRRKLSAGETSWCFVAEFAESTTYTDNIKDADINYSITAPEGSELTNYNFTYCALYNNIMFYAGGGANNGSTMYYSMPDKPSQVRATKYFSVGEGGEPNPITALVEAFGMLIIFKRHGVYALTGDSIENFNISMLFPNVTCTSHGSIIKADGKMFWFGADAIYMWDGASIPTEVSYDIAPTYMSRVKAADILVTGVEDKRLGAVMWNIYGENSPCGNKILVYFYRHSAEIGKTSWSVWDLPVTGNGDGITCLGKAVNMKDGSEQIFWGMTEDPTAFDVSSEFLLGRYDHDGTGYLDSKAASSNSNMPWSWTTGKIDAGAHDINKVWGEITVDAKKQGTTNTLTITPTRNDESADTALTGDMGTSGIIRGNLGKHSRHLKLKFSGSGQAATLYGYMLEVEPEGRA